MSDVRKSNRNNNRKREKLYDGITGIRDNMIEEAESYQFTQEVFVQIADNRKNHSSKKVANRDQTEKRLKKAWITWGGIAACICLIIGGFFAWQHSNGTTDKPGIVVDENGVTIPPMQVSLSSENSAADMIAFFIYEGRSYVEYDRLRDANVLVGEYVGTSIGMIDEWTSEDGYVDFAGSVAGDFYTVNGYDPSFMLCMKDEDGATWIFINNNGITLKTGADLFEKMLGLSSSDSDTVGVKNCTKVKYQTRYDWFNSIGEPLPVEGHAEDISAFIDALNEGEFMLFSDIPLDEGNDNVYDGKEIYHLYFEMENGMTIHLRLFEGGYVNFDGIRDVCVKVDEHVFDGLIETLK